MRRYYLFLAMVLVVSVYSYVTFLFSLDCVVTYLAHLSPMMLTVPTDSIRKL